MLSFLENGITTKIVATKKKKSFLQFSLIFKNGYEFTFLVTICFCSQASPLDMKKPRRSGEVIVGGK